MCTAVLGGSKYCSKCTSGYVPVDGLCVSATARVLAGCTPSTTTAGTCESCKDAYFLQSGGCYQAAVYPGNMLCTTTDNNGKCTKCANGQQTDGKGSCPSCALGCATCADGQTEQCTTCLVGYYKSGSQCFKCDSGNGASIQGVPNCVSCDPPADDSGPVTCYVTQAPAVDPADPSVNKGGLSSGAIAGISVAVIVVVGGLVGFLCWWFICRGKA